MKIALIGYGKMGKMLHHELVLRGHTLSSIVDPKMAPFTTLTAESIKEADVCIDFSNPETVFSNIKFIVHQNKPLVVGTTGWDEHLLEVKALIEKTKTPFIYAPNFSIGVALFTQLIEKAAQLMKSQEAYDVAGLEIHHNQKIDKPSGTAKALAKILNNTLSRKKGSIGFESLRIGQEPGTHTVIFDSGADTITLTHKARSRQGFAEGALDAAEWIINKKGFHTLEDLINEPS